MKRTDNAIDILVVTHRRPGYARLSLERLLQTCDDNMRVWIWHNGDHGETIEVVRSFLDHPRVHTFHHSVDNVGLAAPIAWHWRNATSTYLSKVDDDCLVPEGWANVLRRAHEDVPEFGVIGCWRFRPEDFFPEIAERKIRSYGRHRVLVNPWVEGSGFLMKRDCLGTLGLPKTGISFSMFCKRLATAGWVNGWYYPFLYQEHMDDPRSPYTILRSDEDMQRNMPLTALKFGVRSRDARIRQIREFARRCQEGSADPGAYRGWRAKLRRRVRRVLRPS